MNSWVCRCVSWRHAALVAVVIGGLLATASEGQAQQRIGYVDTEYILNQLPEYTSVQQKLDQLEQRWREEIQSQQERVDTLEEEFEAREVLYTDQERQRKREAIQQARKKVEQLRQQYFGPDGRLYTRQQELMRPIQERVLSAAESVATEAGYDYVLDRKGDTLFLFARDEHNLSDQVLRELGINVDQSGAGE